MMKDRCLTLWEIVEEVGISRRSVHFILTEDLCMRGVSAKFIPKLLMEQQKKLLMEIAQDMLDCANNGFLVKNNTAFMRQPPYSLDLA